MLPFSVACLCFGALFVVIEIASRRFKELSGDTSRKTVHIVAGLMAAFLPNVLTFTEITALGLFFIGFMAVSKKTHLFPSIHGVTRMTLGEVYYPLAIALVAWLFPNPIVYTYAILILAIGDGFAAIIGANLGRHPFSLFGSHKSIEGSATFWVCSVLISAATFVAMGGHTAGVVVLCSLAFASVLTAVEASLTGGLDNLAIPLLAALLLSVAV